MQITKFKSYKKKSGTLVPFSIIKDMPFRVKRIFLIYGNKGFKRGNHAHKKCSQLLVPVSGKIEVSFENKQKKITKILDHKFKKGHLVEPNTWCKLKFLTNNSILMVFCDQEYRFDDYIEKYKDFLKIIKK